MESRQDATGPWLEGIASGLKVVAFAVEEPDVDSIDHASISTRVDRGTLSGLNTTSRMDTGQTPSWSRPTTNSAPALSRGTQL